MTVGDRNRGDETSVRAWDRPLDPPPSTPIEQSRTIGETRASGGCPMSTTTRLLTCEDLLDTPDDGRRYEIIGGELVVSASPLLKHQRLSIRLADLLYELEK